MSGACLALARSLLADQPVRATASALAKEVLSGPRTRSVVWIAHDSVGRDLAERMVDLTPAGPATAQGPAW